MPLSPGTRLGPYEILSPLVFRGKGEVEPLCVREPAGEIPSLPRDLMLSLGKMTDNKLL
jgi:hypothetical protein